jgi:branched-chain amino acid transport system permease protein
MKKTPWLPIAGLGAVLVTVQVLSSAGGCDYYLTQLTMAAYYAIVVLGLCLLMGYAGQISMGHGAFFAIGGYTSAVLTTTPIAVGDASSLDWLHLLGILSARHDLYGASIVTVSPGAAFLAAMALTAAVAALIGYPALRLRGHYLAMATLGFGLIAYRLVLGSTITGAADGITGVPPLDLPGGLTICGARACRVPNYYVAWGLALLTLVVLLNIVSSRVGRALRAIHDGERASEAMGIDTAGFKFRVFVLSALFAAGAGCFLTHFNGGIGPSESGVMKSVRYVALVAAGGMANLWGVLVISTVLNFLSLRGYFGTYDHAVFGLILIAIISLAPDGPLQPIGRAIHAAWKRFALRRLFSPAAGAPNGS